MAAAHSRVATNYITQLLPLLAAIGWTLYERQLRTKSINAYTKTVQPMTEYTIKRPRQLGPTELQASAHDNTSEAAAETSKASQVYYSQMLSLRHTLCFVFLLLFLSIVNCKVQPLEFVGLVGIKGSWDQPPWIFTSNERK